MRGSILSEPALEIARSWSRIQVVTPWQILPSGHVLIGGRSHEIPDELELMSVALARKDGLAKQHFSEDAALECQRRGSMIQDGSCCIR
jgi:hypothetical protein